MIKELKKSVLRTNLRLTELGLVLFTWGNVSAIDRERGLVVIKPSGVEYERMRVRDMVVTDLSGRVIDGKWKPSTDLPTHLELYKAFPDIGGIVHVHSKYATAFAQAGRGIPAYGTTHADYFFGEVSCTRALTKEEIAVGYEYNTGLVIAEAFSSRDPMAVPGCLVKNHGPFTWGETCDKAVYYAAVLEYCAKIALMTEQLNANAEPADSFLLEKHYLRKHGMNAYYGQGENR